MNVTPIGMAGGPEESERAFDEATIAKAHTVFDVVALPSETPLIKAARAAGVNVITGAEVIALQAAEQFERYTGVRPTPEQIAAGLGDIPGVTSWRVDNDLTAHFFDALGPLRIHQRRLEKPPGMSAPPRPSAAMRLAVPMTTVKSPWVSTSRPPRSRSRTAP